MILILKYQITHQERFLNSQKKEFFNSLIMINKIKRADDRFKIYHRLFLKSNFINTYLKKENCDFFTFLIFELLRLA